MACTLTRRLWEPWCYSCPPTERCERFEKSERAREPACVSVRGGEREEEEEEEEEEREKAQQWELCTV